MTHWLTGCSGSCAAQRVTLTSVRAERRRDVRISACLWLLDTVSMVKQQMEQWRKMKGGQTSKHAPSIGYSKDLEFKDDKKFLLAVSVGV